MTADDGADGKAFISGTLVDTGEGEAAFFPGQLVGPNGIEDAGADLRFLPGLTLTVDDGGAAAFVPGQFSPAEDGAGRFVAGRTVSGTFVPGVDGSDGVFVPGVGPSASWLLTIIPVAVSHTPA